MSSGPRLLLVPNVPNSAGKPDLSLEPLREQKGGSVYLAPERGRAIDPRAFQVSFADRWRDFLRAEFQGAVEVGYFFGVSEKGAEKWLRGLGGPNGSKVALAFAMRPDAAAKHLLPQPVGALPRHKTPLRRVA